MTMLSNYRLIYSFVRCLWKKWCSSQQPPLHFSFFQLNARYSVILSWNMQQYKCYIFGKIHPAFVNVRNSTPPFLHAGKKVNLMNDLSTHPCRQIYVSIIQRKLLPPSCFIFCSFDSALFTLLSYPKSLRQECRLSRTMLLVMLSGHTDSQINMVWSIITVWEQHLILQLSCMHAVICV